MKRSLFMVMLAGAALLAGCGDHHAEPAPKTEITLMRFFGSCDAKFGAVNDASQGVG